MHVDVDSLCARLSSYNRESWRWRRTNPQFTIIMLIFYIFHVSHTASDFLGFVVALFVTTTVFSFCNIIIHTVSFSSSVPPFVVSPFLFPRCCCWAPLMTNAQTIPPSVPVTRSPSIHRWRCLLSFYCWSKNSSNGSPKETILYWRRQSGHEHTHFGAWRHCCNFAYYSSLLLRSPSFLSSHTCSAIPPAPPGRRLPSVN